MRYYGMFISMRFRREWNTKNETSRKKEIRSILKGLKIGYKKKD